jgi:predicted ATPase
MIAGTESISTEAKVGADGNGTAQVLESLKNGDREDLFDKIEANFKLYVPEVEKLSLRTVEKGKKQIQVRERGLGGHVLPATELSDGTRLILCILTIIHQEKPPPVILLEDIDRGMHPRIFEQMVPLMKDIAKQHDINIIATTHNPFLVDCFEDDPEAVIIVEKKDGASTLSTLKSRMEGLDYDTANPDEMPLGNLWYSGLVGGVPLPGRRRNRREA